MRWQCDPNLECNDTETLWTIKHCPSTWHNHAIGVSTQQSKAGSGRQPRQSATMSCLVTVFTLCPFSVLCYVSGVQWENECSYETATVAEFQDWLMEQCQPANPLLTYERHRHWCYADYKYMAQLFATKPHILKVFLHV